MKDSNQLLKQAWEVRQNHVPIIWFSVPGAKHYDNRYYSNIRSSFVNLSVTGEACACRCAHCGGKLLQSMVPVTTPAEMRRVVDRLVERNCKGILVSGGANSYGEVPLLPFAEPIAYAKAEGLKVLVHSGLIQWETAAGLKEAGVDQVLIDVIGHERTIREVYHLDRNPKDYQESMSVCREAGLEIAPHVVIGLHFGRILGEIRALEMIREVGPETLVLVILTPACGTEMAGVKPPPVDQVALVMAAARVWNPDTPITLGCARPAGRYKRKIEGIAVDCGVNGMAYPDESTVVYAQSRGLKTVFSEECCSLVADKGPLSMSVSESGRQAEAWVRHKKGLINWWIESTL